MKKTISMLLALCLAAGVLASCTRASAPEQTTAVETTEPTAAETTTEADVQADASGTREDWRAKARAAVETMQGAFGVELMDMTGDGIPEIINHYAEGETDGIFSILTWYNGDYVCAYQLVPVNEQTEDGTQDGERLYLTDIHAYRNNQTGEIEFWDIGDMDYTLEDYYDVDESGCGKLWPVLGVINDNITRYTIEQGKLCVAEDHDELKNFSQLNMTKEEVETAWQALRDFREAFRETHGSEPVDGLSVGYFRDPAASEIDMDHLYRIVEEY